MGEVRGGEAFDLLQALNTGHSGTLSTIHANSAAQALARFSSCVVQSGVELPYQAVRYQIADAINLVLHLRAHGARVVRELIRIGGYDAQHDRYETDTLFSQDVAEEKPMGAPVGTPGPFPTRQVTTQRGNHETSSSARRTSDPGAINRASSTRQRKHRPQAGRRKGTATGGCDESHHSRDGR